MAKLGKGLEPEKRAITKHESDLIRWLLAHSDPGRAEFASQVGGLRVTAKCDCGCPTIYFELEGHFESRTGERVISDHLATVDGQEVGVMLFELNGRLSSLEVYSLAGTDKPFPLPEVESLHSY
jgi:hypothetical protein